MSPHPLRAARPRILFWRALSWLSFLSLAGLPATAAALPLISEVFYDAAGSDDGQSFVELYGVPGTDLTGLVVEGINGSGGAVTDSLALVGPIPADGFFVVADDRGDGVSDVAGADLVLDFDFQNGPDSVVLRGPGGVLDAVGYGAFGAGDVFAGEGAPAADPGAGASIARRFANVDTGDNQTDFVALDVPTPGSGDLAPVPEPAGAALLALGLAGLGAAGRRRG